MQGVYVLHESICIHFIDSVMDSLLQQWHSMHRDDDILGWGCQSRNQAGSSHDNGSYMDLDDGSSGAFEDGFSAENI